MKDTKKKIDGSERGAGVPLLLNLWPLIMFILVLLVFLLRISLQ